MMRLVLRRKLTLINTNDKNTELHGRNRGVSNLKMILLTTKIVSSPRFLNHVGK